MFDPAKVFYAQLLKVFWESHDPTQGMGQGNDIGTQYRSVIFYHSEAQRAAAEQSKADFQKKLHERYFGDITTEIVPAARLLPGPLNRRELPDRPHQGRLSRVRC